MRILIFSASYPPVLGGLQTVTARLARHLSGNGHAVCVVTQRYPRDLPGFEILDGIPVHRILFFDPPLEYVRRGQFLQGAAAGWMTAAAARHLNAVMADFKPELVNVHFPDFQTAYLPRLREKFHFRTVLSFHGHDVTRWFDPAGDEVGTRPNHSSKSLARLRAALEDAHAVTACSNYLLKLVGRLDESALGKGTAIQNGVDLERFESTTSGMHDRPYLFAFGRLTRKKGFDLLLDAWEKVSGQGFGLDLVIAGDGEARRGLESRAASFGPGAGVHFTGRLDAEAIVSWLNGCAGVVIPSRVEPFGIVALEALASGRPILATRVGGMREIFQDEHGEIHAGIRSWVSLVEPTVNDLQAGLLDLIRAAIQEPSRQNNRGFLERFQWSSTGEAYERVYQSDALG